MANKSLPKVPSKKSKVGDQQNLGIELPIGRNHPDALAVDRFSVKMKVKLARKRAEGRGGWENKEECSAEFLSQLLREHVQKGDPIDVANFCMMLHQRGDRITPAPAPSNGPTYLDFITPDEIFDKGRAAVKQWQVAKRAEIERATPPTRAATDE